MCLCFCMCVCVCVFMWACVCVCVCVWACVSPTCPSYVSQGRGFAVGLERTWTPMFSLIKNPLPRSWPSVPLVFKAVGSWRYPIQSVFRVMQMLGGFLLCWPLAIASNLCVRKHTSTVFLLKNGVLTFKSPPNHRSLVSGLYECLFVYHPDKINHYIYI